MSDLQEHQIGERDAMRLSLFQKPNPEHTPVLLLHGASANHRTFLSPVGTPDDPRCLADWLFKQGYEPWLLDWRGNGTIDAESLHRLRNQLDFDFTAKVDIPEALQTIKNKSQAKRICAVGHCMGAATLAQAIAAGLGVQHKELTHVVLLAIGLFYEPAVDGRMRGQDYALERLWIADPPVPAVDPRPNGNWPSELNDFYQNWPASLRSHQHPLSDMDEVCNKVSFMFGQPYRELNLHPEMHRGTFLEEQFGAIPLRMYLQGAQNVRRGWAGTFGTTNDDDTLIGREAQMRFAALEKVTLITGARNQIWNRDSIDRMYAWLTGTRAGRAKSHREILPEYAHQDLLWGKSAYKDVFPKILAGLPPPTERRSPMSPRS